MFFYVLQRKPVSVSVSNVERVVSPPSPPSVSGKGGEGSSVLERTHAHMQCLIQPFLHTLMLTHIDWDFLS